RTTSSTCARTRTPSSPKTPSKAASSSRRPPTTGGSRIGSRRSDGRRPSDTRGASSSRWAGARVDVRSFGVPSAHEVGDDGEVGDEEREPPCAYAASELVRLEREKRGRRDDDEPRRPRERALERPCLEEHEGAIGRERRRGDP